MRRTSLSTIWRPIVWRAWVQGAFSLWAPVVWAGHLAFATLAPQGFLQWVLEDGWLENLQAIGFLVGAILCAQCVSPLARQGLQTWSCGFAVAGVCLFVIAGEEISWGQRVFGWETPDWLKTVNTQDETNLHNLFGPVGSTLRGIMYRFLKPLILLSAISVWPGFHERIRRSRPWLWLPHPMLLPSLLALLSYQYVLGIWHAGMMPWMSERTVGELQEPWEFMLAGVVLMHLAIVRRNLRQDPRAPG